MSQSAIRNADLALIERHQAALRAIDRLDEAADLSAPVMRAMIAQSGPLPSFGPRTGTHPMATRMEPRPMATRIRPPLLDDVVGPADGMLWNAIHALLLSAAAIVVIALILELG